MSYRPYGCEGIGFLINEKFIIAYIKDICNGKLPIESFNELCGLTFDEWLLSEKLSFEDCKNLFLLSDNQDKMISTINSIFDQMHYNQYNGDFLFLDYETYGEVFPYVKDRDCFDFNKDIMGTSCFVIRLSYRFGLFKKPFVNVKDLEKEITTNISIPEDYNIFDNIVYYSSVVYG